ncbi:unnamed protein product [Orchesella dallaii]|uniref:Ion transport domain-containing protein n=1 Tax=Orchesella dallaii TaxID=48710 RepID=A0ABP1Q934_9HEXA
MVFPLGCLFFAILANFFTESKAAKELEMEEITGLADVHDFDGVHNPEALVVKEKNIEATEELLGFRKSLHSFVFHDAIRNLLISVIFLDIFGISCYHYGILESTFNTRLFLVIIPYFVFLIYTIEFLLKIIALGPAKYFKIRWNHIDFIVLLTFFLEIQSYFGEFSGYMLAPIRLLKLIQYWPSLRMIFKIYSQTLKILSGWILYGIIVFAFIVFIGPFELGTYELEDYKGGKKFTSADIPRWSFMDFWHTFRIVVRMQFGEWIETFWICYNKAGSACVPYYLLANLCGALLLSFLLVGVVYSTLKELQGNYDPSKDRGLRLCLRKTCGLICSPIKRIQPKELITKSQKNGSDAENGADEQTKPEGKEGRGKKSIVAESTGQLRKVMQDCTEHVVYKIVVCSIIIIASIAMVFENKHAGEDLQTGLFVIEILFTVLFFVIAVYELLSYGFKESFTNRGWLFDALIILEMILNLSIYKFSVTGPFRLGAFCIRSLRPLMLIYRVDWLKCFDPVEENTVDGPMTRTECMAKNMSWHNSYFNFDDTATGFINMVVLSSTMGWVLVINGAGDAVGIDQQPQQDATKMWFIYFILFLFVGALGPLGILFSYIYNKFQQDNCFDILLTENQADTYNQAKTSKQPKQAWIALESDFVPPPVAPCLLSFYNLVTNIKFDAAVMVLIIVDNIILSVVHDPMYPNVQMVLTCLGMAILLLFFVEMIVKLVAWGRHYFRSVWNWIDLIVVVSGIIELLAMEFSAYVLSASLIRMLRLFRIFRFLLGKKCGSDTAKILFSSLLNIRHAFGNLLLLQLIVIWAFALLGNYSFARLAGTAGIDDVANFRTFSSSVWTLILLLGFSDLDMVYYALSKDEDCCTDPESDEQCSSRASAVWFIGLYAATTFIVLLNMYSVLICEIISEIARYKNLTKISDEEVPLRDVTTENGLQMNGDGGEQIGELTEDPVGNSEEEE